MTTPLVVCSFFVERIADYPDAVDYIPLLKALDRSCRRLGFDHVVLTDNKTAPQIAGAGMLAFPTDLPRNLAMALTEAQARWLDPLGYDTLFVGADCLIRRDFREHLPVADLSIILRPGHKRHRINNGFMFVPAASVASVAPLFRRIANDTGNSFNKCNDMEAVERALSPMPTDYCLTERAGLTVNFLPMEIWNAGPRKVDDAAEQAHVLHFRGKVRKAVMIDWAKRWLT